MLNQIFDEVIEKIQMLKGIDLVYFLDSDYKVLKELKITEADNCLDQIKEIIKLESLSNKIGEAFYSKDFHTYTLLNESGLIVISKLSTSDTIYMVIIAGEDEPVDLINLLKICKETRSTLLAHD